MSLIRPKKIIICFSGTFFRKCCRREAFYFYFLLINCYKNKHPWQARKWVHQKPNNQPTNKMVANDGPIKLTVCGVYISFQCEYWKCETNFLCGGLKVTRVPENHLINFFGLMFVLTDSMLLRKKKAVISYFNFEIMFTFSLFNFIIISYFVFSSFSYTFCV